MIIIHIGLPKTASTKFLLYINKYTNISTTFWIKNNETKNKLREMRMIEALKFDYKSLSYNKNYFIKSPDFIYNCKLSDLLDKIKQSGHKFKIIVGIRDIKNVSYSLYNHWKRTNELQKNQKCPLDVYNTVLSKFFSNIDKQMLFLKNYDTIIYNIDNYKGTWFTFFSDIFKLLEIKEDIKESLPDEKIQISKYTDVDNLEEKIKDIKIITETYNKYFEGKTIFKI